MQVILSVSAGNEAAERLYRGCGFEVYGREPRAVMMDGLAIAKLYMILMLDRHQQAIEEGVARRFVP
ncbi:MAG: hypothetical protein J0H82_35460 [Alphaproteobacteria bacterium]|jgi:ribosomal protein S18 acetylase RimI-like enzyme|nr:hypothetical protein [Alphaproteobacteria bacterium]